MGASLPPQRSSSGGETVQEVQEPALASQDASGSSSKLGPSSDAPSSSSGALALAPHPACTALAGRAGRGKQATTATALGELSRGPPQQQQPLVVCTHLAIHELDEEAIELIFTFLPPSDRRSAAAVCRLWRRVHNSSTKLWGSVLLSGERIVQAAASAASAGTLVTWVAARLEAMRNVRLWSPYPLELFAAGLAQLLSRENRLQSFSYVSSDASVSRLLSELQGLTSLQLLDILSPAMVPGQGLVVRARELAKLMPLRNLLSLKLHASEIRGALPPALFRCLNRLQHLAISAKCCLPAAVVRQLTGLQSLELQGASMDEAAAEAAAALQQLTRLGISIRSYSAQQQQEHQQQQQQGEQQQQQRGAAGGAAAPDAVPRRWQDHPIWGQLPLLSRLQELVVGAELPAEATAGGGDGEGGEMHPAVLHLADLEGSVPDGIMDCSSLTHLALPVALTCLPDLLPGQLPCLQQLDLTHSIVEALPPSWCSNLQSLRRLVLSGAPLAGGCLPREFACLRGLQHLELRACRLLRLPQCVAALPALRHLDLGINRLEGLPPGPYLASLRCLVLRDNALCALPPVLGEAGQLEALDLGENPGLVLQEGDVPAVLARMPRLRLLVLSRQPAGFGFGPFAAAASGAAWDAQSVGVLMQLARALPALEVRLERCCGGDGGVMALLPLLPEVPDGPEAGGADSDGSNDGSA